MVWYVCMVCLIDPENCAKFKNSVDMCTWKLKYLNSHTVQISQTKAIFVFFLCLQIFPYLNVEYTSCFTSNPNQIYEKFAKTENIYFQIFARLLYFRAYFNDPFQCMDYICDCFNLGRRLAEVNTLYTLIYTFKNKK